MRRRVDPTVKPIAARASAGPSMPVNTNPHWRILAIALLGAGLVMLPLLGVSVSLYVYAFPLFGVGVTYVVQFRSSLSRAWWITFAAITPLSVVALALNWPFSGHVLWNILFIGHNRMAVRSRSWNWVLTGSLLHLLILKAAFQTPRDLLGALLSACLAFVILRLLRPQ